MTTLADRQALPRRAGAGVDRSNGLSNRHIQPPAPLSVDPGHPSCAHPHPAFSTGVARRRVSRSGLEPKTAPDHPTRAYPYIDCHYYARLVACQVAVPSPDPPPTCGSISILGRVVTDQDSLWWWICT